MKVKNVMLFSYDFPHKKTQDFIFRLLIENYNIKYVMLAPWQKLNISRSLNQIEPQYSNLVEPKLICKRFGIKYISTNHNSQLCKNFLLNNPVDIYIISGARLLNSNIINAANHKVLNIHSGLLPETRGLDTLFWAIKNDIPIGISGHLIGNKIDSGKLIYKEKLRLYRKDSLIDIGFRLLDNQSNILIKSLKYLQKNKPMVDLDSKNIPYYSKMSKFEELETIKKFKFWLKKYSDDK